MFREASSEPPTNQQRLRRTQIILQAGRTDDVALVSSLLSAQDSQDNVRDLSSKIIWRAIRSNAPKVLRYALDHGGKPPDNSSLGLEKHSKEILEILVAHGWDINARSPGDLPFIWEVLGDGDLVKWALDHGAMAIPRDLDLDSEDERKKDQMGTYRILQSAAIESTVEVFELLRARGGQLGPKTLHYAAQFALGSENDGHASYSTSTDSDHVEPQPERLAMVAHLVDTLKLDPNALDLSDGRPFGNHLGTPLCYVAKGNFQCSEVVRYLLQRGADPHLTGWDAVEIAKKAKNGRFLKLVESWEMKK